MKPFWNSGLLCLLPATVIACGCTERKVKPGDNEKVRHESMVAVSDLNNEPVCIYFEDFHLNGSSETVRVKGKEIKTDETLVSVLVELRELTTTNVEVAIGKKPHPDIAKRIRLLEKECKGMGINVDTSADELYLLLGGDLPVSSK